MKEYLSQLIREAGKLSLQFFKRLDSIKISSKTPKDLVTEADVEVESFIKKRLLDKYPKCGFWGEESGKIKGEKGNWIVDPIDGTHSFIHGQYFWSVSIAFELDGELLLGAVYAPLLDDLYLAEKGKGAWKNNTKIQVSSVDSLAKAMVGTGFACLRASREDNNLERFCKIALKTMDQRRLGSAALDMCLVADGQLDGFWEQDLNYYDVAAGAIIALEAGASITDFSGKPGLNPSQTLATNGKILSQILPLM